MKGIIFTLVTLFFSVGFADAAVRDENSVSRVATSQKTITTRQPVRGISVQKNTTTIPRAASNIRSVKNTRAATTARSTTTNARTASNISITRGATPQQNKTTARNATAIARTPHTTNTRNARSAINTARATSTTTDMSTVFGTGYNACRDAYFTCMDQFCATANESYRRCVCSSKLTEIQSRERALSQTASQLQDFKGLNISVIDKTGAEVQAMLSASEGETAQANAKDKSDSAKQLSGISEVLSNTKSKALSTQGSLDIAGDINQIWNTTDLTGGASIANLTGEALYNAVHAQCSEMVNDVCETSAIKTMVTSAYGMYIENDCTLVIGGLDKQLTTANTAIKSTEKEMQDARLKNYDTHNSTPINDCIAQVRKDITANTACGTDYVHCLDITGKYLNYETGEPIYSPDFFQLETQVSLSGNILTNQTNQNLVTRLNSMRNYASRGLDTCRDLSDDVWDEFMRQAITEIYQGQQERIRLVKNECLEVVNKCYDEQSESLKDFSNIDEKLLLGQRLELSEKMCREKLDACSNLYGGGTNGMHELIDTMTHITDQQIAQQCLTTLRDFAKELCAVPGNDTLHSYPYACRVYAPGDQMFANITECNTKTIAETIIKQISATPRFMCSAKKQYTQCNYGYYFKNGDCLECPRNYSCAGGFKKDENGKATTIHSEPEPLNCGTDYIGSLYQKMVKYASQVCVRPSKANDVLPDTVLQDINVVMDEITMAMSNELSQECERLGGVWIATPYISSSSDTLFDDFYTETSANTMWGYCTKP
ncbi:MAG: hypothetical protein IKB59_02820 [Alphaproteobacteria bacterium]|nr:hypothetical protein [Alphaproteobacteria bacterium]